MTTTANALDSLAGLPAALKLDAAEIAAALGTTARTVKAWIAGARRPSETNRIGLVSLALAAQRELSSGQRMNVGRDNALRALRIALHTPAQRQQWLANRAELRAQFGAVR